MAGLCFKGALLRLLGAGIARLPASAVPALGARLARIGPLMRRRRHIARCNLDACFPGLDPREREQLLAGTLASNTTGALDTLRAWFAQPAQLAGLADFSGLEYLEAARATRRGAVIVAAHYDSVELAIRLIADASPPIALMRRRYNDPCIDAAVDAGRGRYLARLVDKKDVAGFCDVVREGGIALYAPDQNASRRTAFVPFFGVPAATIDAIPGVLRRAGGAVLLMWCRRLADGRFRLGLEPAPETWREAEGAEVAAQYMAWIERKARDAPEQYLWVHRRFRTRPAGMPDLYSRR
jgi:KDO2-lipid IV(A) lauroyltransferase